MHNDVWGSLLSASWYYVEAGHLSFPICSPDQAVDKTRPCPLSQFPLSLNPYLKSLLPKVLCAQHSESSCADESRPLAQNGRLRFTISHQGHHAAIHTDRHTVPPAGRRSQWEHFPLHSSSYTYHCYLLSVWFFFSTHLSVHPIP